MCWSHVHSNLLPRLKSILPLDKTVHTSILKDIADLQWSVLNEGSFRHVFSLIEAKYIGKYNDVMNGILAEFFRYMRKVWVDSDEFRWFEGSHPWHISNNQGVEGKNKDIKLNYTFRKRLELGELIGVLDTLVTEWSDESDHLLESSRLAALHGQKNSLKLRTDGYQYYLKNIKGSKDKILRINNPDGKYYTVSESSEFDLGRVPAIYVVNSSAGEKSGLPLKERAKQRLSHRRLPLSSSFDDYLTIRSSCWILEERDGDYFCDCPVGMKVSCMMYYSIKLKVFILGQIVLPYQWCPLPSWCFGTC
jgi:hypothetical protein